METVHAVFFDVDGTLVDSNEFHVRAWERAFAEDGIPICRPLIRQQIGKGSDQLIPALVPGIDAERYHAIDAAHAAQFQSQYLHQVRPFPGASAFIGRLHRGGIRIVLVSSSGRADLDHYVELLHIAPYLTAIVSGDEARHSKPAADLFEIALQRVAPLAPAQILTVGDTPYDVIAAAKCGIRSIALTSGGVAESELRDAGAAFVYESIGALSRDWGPLSKRATTVAAS